MVVKNYKYSDEDLLKSLKKANEIVDGNLTIPKYRNIQKEHNLPTAIIIIKRIGWNEGKKKAGIKGINIKAKPFKKTASPQDIKKAIKKPFRYLKEKYGEKFTAAQYAEESKGKKDWPSLWIISKTIGWNNAKAEFGYTLNYGKPSEEEIIAHLLKAADVFGRNLTIEEYNEYVESVDENVIKGFTVASYYGWNNIKEKAGLKNNSVGSNKNKPKVNQSIIQRNRFCRDCMEYEDCNIELQHCEYYDYYKEGVAN